MILLCAPTVSPGSTAGGPCTSTLEPCAEFVGNGIVGDDECDDVCEHCGWLASDHAVAGDRERA